jgi:excisionase family DNA binding protein
MALANAGKHKDVIVMFGHCTTVANNSKRFWRKSMKVAADPRAALVDEGLVSVGQAAAFLGLSRSSIYTLMEKGELAFAKIGGSRRIPRKALTQLAERSLVSAG